jgi:5-methyltetrahydrofolate--homocysteine methyltransferase
LKRIVEALKRPPPRGLPRDFADRVVAAALGTGSAESRTDGGPEPSGGQGAHPSYRRRSMGLIRIAESLHCHIPSVQRSVRGWLCGDAAEREAGERHLVQLVKDQTEAGADYLDVNVDNFLADSAVGREGALRALGHILALIQQHGRGLPACIDSSDPGVLEAGLKRYYEMRGPGGPPPLLNSVAVSKLETLALRKAFRFSVVGMLLEKVGGTSAFTEVAGPEAYCETARFLFDRARGAGFEAGEVFFDPTVGPLGADTVGYTRRTFEGIRGIRSDAHMAGVHICIGLSNCSDGLPRRLAINRAYLRVAMEYGLDAAILDVTKVTGRDLVDGEILRLVRHIVKAEPEEMLDILVDFVQATKQKKG